MKDKTEIDRLLSEIKTFIAFAVEKSKCDAAYKLVEQYKDDPLALRLFHEHYAALPDAIEEAVVKVYQLNLQRGVHCLLLQSETAYFIYLVSIDDVVYAGNNVDDLSADLVAFIGHGDKKKLTEAFSDFSDFSEYTASQSANSVKCPACGVIEGEPHILGCMAEVCPWCDGQLSKCNCRFEKMDVEEFTSEKQLEAFEELLEDEGRVPFAKDQQVSYPGMSEGLDKG